jgi:branched-subunit amino acid transport protein
VLELWLVVIAAAGATYLWRALGAALSGHITIASELFNWIACVAYAMLAGLISRMLFLPTGMLADTLLVDRLAACALALAAYHASRRNLLVAVAAGVAGMMAIAVVRGW